MDHIFLSIKISVMPISWHNSQQRSHITMHISECLQHITLISFYPLTYCKILKLTKIPISKPSANVFCSYSSIYICHAPPDAQWCSCWCTLMQQLMQQLMHPLMQHLMQPEAAPDAAADAPPDAAPDAPWCSRFGSTWCTPWCSSWCTLIQHLMQQLMKLMQQLMQQLMQHLEFSQTTSPVS